MPRRKTKLYMTEIAAKRIIQAARLIGRDMNYEYGWISHVSRELGISRSMAQELCSGSRTRVGMKTVNHVCNALGLTPDDLMRE